MPFDRKKLKATLKEFKDIWDTKKGEGDDGTADKWGKKLSSILNGGPLVSYLTDALKGHMAGKDGVIPLLEKELKQYLTDMKKREEDEPNPVKTETIQQCLEINAWLNNNNIISKNITG